jgi:hypothetical protein
VPGYFAVGAKRRLGRLLTVFLSFPTIKTMSRMSKLMVEGARDALGCAIDKLRRHPTLGGNWKDAMDALEERR